MLRTIASVVLLTRTVQQVRPTNHAYDGHRGDFKYMIHFDSPVAALDPKPEDLARLALSNNRGIFAYMF